MRGFQYLLGHESKRDVPLGYSALAGSIAGIGYWGVPYPADTIKSRIQTDPRMEGKGFIEIGAFLFVVLTVFGGTCLNDCDGVESQDGKSFRKKASQDCIADVV